MVSFPDQQQQIGGGLMGVARFDEGTPENHKFESAGAAASWLWFASVCYSRRTLSDGFIPRYKVATLVANLKQPYKHAEQLVAAGLWEIVEGGYRIHDYFDWNPTKAQVEDYRRKDRDRKQRQHVIQSEVPRGIQTESERNPRDLANARATHAGAKSEYESESERSTVGKEETRPSAEIAPVWNPHGVRPHSRSLVGSHTGCYPTPKACARGICLPGWLGSNWLRQFADPAHGEREIEATVSEAVEALPDGPISEKPQKFWEAVWAARHPSRAPVTATKTAGKGLTALSSFASAEARRSARGEGS